MASFKRCIETSRLRSWALVDTGSFPRSGLRGKRIRAKWLGTAHQLSPPPYHKLHSPLSNFSPGCYAPEIPGSSTHLLVRTVFQTTGHHPVWWNHFRRYLGPQTQAGSWSRLSGSDSPVQTSSSAGLLTLFPIPSDRRSLTCWRLSPPSRCTLPGPHLERHQSGTRSWHIRFGLGGSRCNSFVQYLKAAPKIDLFRE